MKSISFIIAAFLCLMLPLPGNAQIASGGGYTLERTVIAGGGGQILGGARSLESTVGQPTVRPQMSNGSYALWSGFWTPDSFAPTSANASISGRVIRKGGVSLSNATLTLYGGPLSSPHITLTSSLGYFKLENIPVGYFYILSVHHRKYSFAQNTYEFSLFDDLSDIVFHASEIPHNSNRRIIK